MMETSLHVIIRFATNSGADVEVIFRSRYQDTLSFTPVSSKHVLERLFWRTRQKIVDFCCDFQTIG